MKCGGGERIRKCQHTLLGYGEDILPLWLRGACVAHVEEPLKCLGADCILVRSEKIGSEDSARILFYAVCVIGFYNQLKNKMRWK